ncbi:hypothetical protein ACWGMO_30110, partial [Nocardia salmonicida]
MNDSDPAEAILMPSPSLTEDDRGVVFPTAADGTRVTSPTLRAILADAAHQVDPELAQRVRATDRWRKDYTSHLADITAASAADPKAALSSAHAGLASMRQRLVFHRQGSTVDLTEATSDRLLAERLGHRLVAGSNQEPQPELVVPYRGELLAGVSLSEQLATWVSAGVVEPSFALAIQRIIDHPKWLRLNGRSIAVVGAGAELAPTAHLLNWGAHVMAIDIPRPGLWQSLIESARSSAGTMSIPLDAAGTPGCSLVYALPEILAWIDEHAEGPTTLGMYGYADGGMHVRLTAAFDALVTALTERRPGTSVAYLATPTDAFLVPDQAVEFARRAHDASRTQLGPRLLHAVSAGRLLAKPYGAQPSWRAIIDVLVPQQGPNYAMAKRLQRWRGIASAADRIPVSFNVAPATRTRSVTKNRSLAAAYAGAHHFGIEIFEPDTCRALMAALLVHDLHQPNTTVADHPESLFSDAAAHGGLWRAAYA